MINSFQVPEINMKQIYFDISKPAFPSTLFSTNHFTKSYVIKYEQCAENVTKKSLKIQISVHRWKSRMVIRYKVSGKNGYC